MGPEDACASPLSYFPPWLQLPVGDGSKECCDSPPRNFPSLLQLSVGDASVSLAGCWVLEH
uniref:Uncharacterized protein n=1 Tax=Nelumbo nucifera TaxID=4432 RepID=A0A822YKC6_NELNU|nr:TPA_asm: hypothetical protein HUJ06_010276 [Nelumbo nucifera]